MYFVGKSKGLFVRFLNSAFLVSKKGASSEG